MRYSFLFILFIAFTMPAYAGSKKDELQKVQSDLDSQKDKQQDLAEQQQDIEEKMNDLQGNLVKISRDIQTHEQAALELHDKQEKTESDIVEADKKLQAQRQSLATTIMALERLNQMPPQAVLARPSAPIDMARTFDLLQKVIPAVAEQAQQVKLVVKNLQDLHDTQEHQAEQIRDEQQKLTAQRKELTKTVKQRQALLQENKSQQKEVSRTMATLSSRASDLQDLMHRIEEQAKHKQKADIVQSVKGVFDKVVSNLGSFRMPVTGRVAQDFGQNTSEGVTSQGVMIAAQPGSIVTAPSGGIIRFAGPFRQYKLLVIIQHANGDHSLIGGMEELYTQTGANVVTGEPLGKLPDRNVSGDKLTGDSGASSSLYYERRRNGKPIDPRLARG
jgi:septal ring factor EnvC (AmiA/AmiB activator)